MSTQASDDKGECGHLTGYELAKCFIQKCFFSFSFSSLDNYILYY